MRTDRVREGETLGGLAGRLGVPACMLLRANRVLSPAWLTPGREIRVPGGEFCLYDGFICPAVAANIAAGSDHMLQVTVGEGDTVGSIAGKYRVTARMVIVAAGTPHIYPGQKLMLPLPPEGSATVTALPGDSVEGVCARRGVDTDKVRALNSLWGAALPGVQILIPPAG